MATLVTKPYGLPYRVTGLVIIGVFALLYVIAVPNWPAQPW